MYLAAVTPKSPFPEQRVRFFLGSRPLPPALPPGGGAVRTAADNQGLRRVAPRRSPDPFPCAAVLLAAAAAAAAGRGVLYALELEGGAEEEVDAGHGTVVLKAVEEAVGGDAAQLGWVVQVELQLGQKSCRGCVAARWMGRKGGYPVSCLGCAQDE